jgi:hypothetical protein
MSDLPSERLILRLPPAGLVLAPSGVPLVLDRRDPSEYAAWLAGADARLRKQHQHVEWLRSPLGYGDLEYVTQGGNVKRFDYLKAKLVVLMISGPNQGQLLVRTEDDHLVALRDAPDDRWAIELGPEEAWVWLQSGRAVVLGRRAANSPDEFAIDLRRPQFALQEHLPDPSKLTVGGLARLVGEIEQLDQAVNQPQVGYDNTSQWKQMDRQTWRELVLARVPGFSEFQTYCNAELGMRVIPAALEEVKRRLARRLGTSFDEVQALTLEEALVVLNRPLTQVGTVPSPAAVPLDPRWSGSRNGAPEEPTTPPAPALEQEQGLVSHEATRRAKPVADPTPATSAPPQPTTPARGATEGEQGPEAPTEQPAPKPPTTPAPAGATSVKPSGNEPPPPAPAGKPKKEPSNVAFAAYHLWKTAGLCQGVVARRLQEELHIPVDQSKVSRWCKEVTKWLGAGNSLPCPRRISMDPRTLEQGPRRDGRR